MSARAAVALEYLRDLVDEHSAVTVYASEGGYVVGVRGAMGVGSSLSVAIDNAHTAAQHSEYETTGQG